MARLHAAPAEPRTAPASRAAVGRVAAPGAPAPGTRAAAPSRTPGIARAAAAPMSVRDAAPEPPLSARMPAIARTAAPGGFAAAIARSGLGAASSDGGSSTVTFGAPAQDGIPEYVPFSTAPVTVSRSPAEAAPAPEVAAAPEPSSATATATPAPPPAPAATDGAGGDNEKLFDDLFDRLKRELLLEQEQLGQAFHEP